MQSILKRCVTTIIMVLLYAAPASAITLEVEPNSHWVFHLGAAILLYTHIGGGTIGIITGVIASLTIKGSLIHRKAGKVFFWSMFVCYLIGGIVAPFLTSQQSTNFVAACLALYLLLSGVSTARRKKFVAGTHEKIGLVIAIVVTALGGLFMYLSAQSPDGSFDGSPPQAYILFVVVGSAAVIGEIKVLIQKQLSPAGRIGRHMWRMCMSFFIASGAAFFGQAQFFPDWFNQSLLPIALGFFPLLIMLVYIGKYSFLAVAKK